MAYFECIVGNGGGGGGIPLTVNCSANFAGSTISVSDGTKTLTAQCPSSSPYTVEFSLPNDGIWTASGVYSGTTYYSEPVTITPYETNLNITPEGATVTPTDDIQIWMHCANIWDKAYTTINQVLADSTTLLALISSNNAADYMARSTTLASSVCANSTAMTYIGANNYCANSLLADSTWLSAICNSAYFENVLNVKVPTMTSDTTPSGEAYASNVFSSTYAAWKAFDGDDSTPWLNEVESSYIYYKFPSSQKILLCKFKSNLGGGGYKVKTYQIDGADNTSNWTNLTAILTAQSSDDEQSVILNNNVARTYYRFYIKSSYFANHNGLNTLQFYGREDV